MMGLSLQLLKANIPRYCLLYLGLQPKRYSILKMLSINTGKTKVPIFVLEYDFKNLTCCEISLLFCNNR